MNSKNAVKFARETCEILFYRAVLLRLGKVRELVQEINDQHVGTQFIIKRQPAVRYPSTIYLYQNDNITTYEITFTMPYATDHMFGLAPLRFSLVKSG